MAGIIFSPLHRSPSIRGRDKANAGNYAVNQNLDLTVERRRRKEEERGKEEGEEKKEEMHTLMAG